MQNDDRERSIQEALKRLAAAADGLLMRVQRRLEPLSREAEEQARRQIDNLADYLNKLLRDK